MKYHELCSRVSTLKPLFNGDWCHISTSILTGSDISLLPPGGAPDYIIFHLQGPFVRGDNMLEVLAGGSTEFSINGTAGAIAPHGDHNYVVNFSWSTNQNSPP